MVHVIQTTNNNDKKGRQRTRTAAKQFKDSKAYNNQKEVTFRLKNTYRMDVIFKVTQTHNTRKDKHCSVVVLYSRCCSLSICPVLSCPAAYSFPHKLLELVL